VLNWTLEVHDDQRFAFLLSEGTHSLGFGLLGVVSTISTGSWLVGWMLSSFVRVVGFPLRKLWN